MNVGAGFLGKADGIELLELRRLGTDNRRVIAPQGGALLLRQGGNQLIGQRAHVRIP